MTDTDYALFRELREMDYDAGVARVTELLAGEGFGVLTEIDVRATLKKKLDVEFRNYRILGACSPHHAYKALSAEDKIGAMLPCNVIVQETEAGQVEVAAIDHDGNIDPSPIQLKLIVDDVMPQLMITSRPARASRIVPFTA